MAYLNPGPVHDCVITGGGQCGRVKKQQQIYLEKKKQDEQKLLILIRSRHTSTVSSVKLADVRVRVQYLVRSSASGPS